MTDENIVFLGYKNEKYFNCRTAMYERKVVNLECVCGFIILYVAAIINILILEHTKIVDIKNNKISWQKTI